MPVFVYPSKLEGEPLETHLTHGLTSINQWFVDNVKNYAFRDPAPLSVILNGAYVHPSEWALTFFGVNDQLCVYPEPKAAGSFAAYAVYAAVVVAAVVAAVVLLQPSVPKPGKQQGRGDALDEASAKGNKVKPNAVIREVSGRRKVFPDYLIPNHRYFESIRRQVVETHLCIGKGEFDIPPSSVLIGDTPMISLGDDASFTIYGPGADVSADARCVWWHSAPEIGATSTGTAGLELTATTAADPAADAIQYIFTGYTITIPSGAGEFPDSWESGMIVRVDGRYPYTVDEGVGVGVRDVINGDMAQLGLAAGALIEIAGDNEGDYIIDTIDEMAGTMTLDYSNGDPAASLALGDRRMAISYRGLRYRITAVSSSTLTLERLDDTGATDTGWPGFSGITLDDAIISLDESTLEGGWVGPFAACPAGETTELLEWDVFFPNGLVKVKSSGSLGPRSVTVDLEYRDLNTAGAWTSVSTTYTERILDQLGFTESLALPYAMQPEVRVRRIGPKSSDPAIQDGVQWYGLRSKLQGPSSYAGVTTVAIKVAGGGKLAAQAEQQISVLATRKLPTRVDGNWTAPVVTRDLAPWLVHVAKSLGYTDSDIDLAELDRLDAIWRDRGDTYDDVIESATTAKEALNRALLTGFSEMTIDRGLLRPVRDEPRSVYEHMYTPQNMTDPLVRQFSAYTPDDIDGVDVEYTDGRTWNVETVECRLSGDVGLRTEKIQVPGVTNRDKAWQIGMRSRRAAKYRRYVYEFRTELDALNSRYLSFTALGDDVPGYNKSAILMAVSTLGSGHLLVSSEPFDWSAGGAHMVAIRRKDGTLSGPYTATRVDDYRLTIFGLDFVPDTTWQVEPPHLLFGPVTRWSYPALITEISPTGRTGVNVKAINYDARVYADDNNTPS